MHSSVGLVASHHHPKRHDTTPIRFFRVCLGKTVGADLAGKTELAYFVALGTKMMQIHSTGSV
jgi:hypothetical protein